MNNVYQKDFIILDMNTDNTIYFITSDIDCFFVVSVFKKYNQKKVGLLKLVLLNRPTRRAQWVLRGDLKDSIYFSGKMNLANFTLSAALDC